MPSEWSYHEKRLQKLALARLQRMYEALSFHQRRDPLLLALFILLALAVGSSLLVGVKIVSYAGLFNPPILSPVEDQRALSNLRAELPKKPFLTAALHSAENALFVTQQGGTVHRYAIDLKLWSEEFPREQASLLTGDLTNLRSGCGTVFQSRSQGSPDLSEACPDNNSLWALTNRGGLVRRDGDGNWRVAFGDVRFVGLDGKPVQHEELSTAALSPDGAWLLVGTKKNGVGLLSQRTNSWIPQTRFEGDLSAPHVKHIKWLGDRFWIGAIEGKGSGSLAALAPSESKPTIETIAGIDGEIIDLDTASDGSLLVLERGRCRRGGVGCLRLLSFSMDNDEEPNQPNQSIEKNNDNKEHGPDPRVLFSQTEKHPDLNLERLSFASLQGGVATTAGQAGVFSYDPVLHSWEQLDGRPATAIYQPPGEEKFYYGFPGGAAAVDQGRVAKPVWNIPQKTIKKILRGPASELFALSEDGAIYSLLENGRAKELFDPGGTDLDPTSFRRSLLMGDAVLLLGDQGALLHNIRSRGYAGLKPDTLPQWFFNSDTFFLTAAPLVYAFNSNGKVASGLVLNTDEVLDGKKEPADLWPNLKKPLSKIRAWEGKSASLIDGNGSAIKLSPSGATLLTGPPAHDMKIAHFADVLVADKALHAAARQGVRSYDLELRAWSEWKAAPRDSGGFKGLELADDKLLGFTDSGLLAQVESGEVLIGSRAGFNISDEELSDAALLKGIDPGLCLAGNGRIECYSLKKRRIEKRLHLGEGPVDIVDKIGEKILSIAGEKIFLDEEPITQDRGAVLSAGIDSQRMWTMRKGRQGNFLTTRLLVDPFDEKSTACFFRQPRLPVYFGLGEAAEDLEQIIDVREISEGWLAVLTRKGVHFYSESFRTWRRGHDAVAEESDRLYVFGGQLGWLSDGPKGDRLRITALDRLKKFNGCSVEPLLADFKIIDALSIAVNESTGTVAWLDENREIHNFSERIKTVQHEAKGDPDAENLWKPRAELPGADRIMVQNKRWTWRRSGGKTQVVPAGENSPLNPWDANKKEELGFPQDQLKAAAGDGDGLFILSESFLERAADFPGLAAGAVKRIPAQNVSEIRLFPEGKDLYGKKAGETIRLNRTNNAERGFVKVEPNEDPYLFHTLAVANRLRMDRTPNGINKRLLMDDPKGGAPRWIEFDFTPQGFPFDVVTGLTKQRGRIYVGTKTGLQIYSRGLNFGFNDMEELMDIGPDRSEQPSPAVRLGRLVKRPDTVLASSKAGCFLLEKSTVKECGDEADAYLDRGETKGLWRWRTGLGNRPEGRYLKKDDRMFDEPVELIDGRFPHDRLDDVIACSGVAATLWKDGKRISTHRSAVLGMLNGIETVELPGVGAEGFACVEARGSLMGGLYLLGDKNAFRFEKPNWTIVDDEARSALKEAPPPNDNVVFAKKRLRLLSDGQSFKFQHKTQKGKWQDLTWSGNGAGGRLEIDNATDVVIAGGRVWAASAGGFVLFSSASGGLEYDPDGLDIIPLPKDPNGDKRLITESVDVFGETIIRFNGRSDAVYSVRLAPNVGEAKFVLIKSPDPFASDDLPSADGDILTWRMAGREGGNPGRLYVRFKGEDATLAQGSFGFDNLLALEESSPGIIELATAAGWFRSSLADFGLPAFSRPKASLNRAVQADLVKNVKTVLFKDRKAPCLEIGQQRAIILAPDQGINSKTESCDGFLGRGPLWTYSEKGGDVSITAGPLEKADKTPLEPLKRKLKDGRFLDLSVRGLPVPKGFLESAKATAYIVPTEAGLTTFTLDGAETGILAGNFPGMPLGEAPWGLVYRLHSERPLHGEPLYVAPEGLFSVSRFETGGGPDQRPKLILPQPLSPGASGLTVTEDVKGRLELMWTQDAEPFRMPAVNVLFGESQEQNLAVNVSSWKRFKEYKTKWNNPVSLLSVSMAGGHVAASGPDRQRLLFMANRRLFPLNWIRKDTNLFILEETELWQLDLEQVFSKVFLPSNKAPNH